MTEETKEKKQPRKTAEEEALEQFSPEMEMDYLIRVQQNALTETKYHFYQLYKHLSPIQIEKGKTNKWSAKQHEEWGTDRNEDGTHRSELFDGVPYEHNYVVAIPETGEWKSFKSRVEITQDRTSGAMYPYAKGSKHETARMAVYDSSKLMSLACSMALPENCENEVAYLTARDIKEAALMLLSTEAERRQEAELYDEMLDIRGEEE